jgi:hypothetical protein
MLGARKWTTLHIVCLHVCATLAACSGAPEEPEPQNQPSSLDVIFVPAGGTFLGSQSVELSVGRPGAEVHFTVDGSTPTASSPVYSAPILLEASTRIRALAVVPSASAPGAVGTSGASGVPAQPAHGAIEGETYLRVAPDAASFSSHLPIVVIHTFESGRLDEDGTQFVPANLTLLQPTSGITNLVGRAALDTRIGIHVRGETSREFPKKQYAVELWTDATNEDVDEPLLGMPLDSDWILSDPIPLDRTMVRNALAFEMSNRIGRYAPRTRFVEAFLADAGGDVRTANFLGLYTVIEKIKRGVQRVDVVQLSDEHTAEPGITGGFILRIDKGENQLQAGGLQLQYVYPEPEAMALGARRAQVDFIRRYVDEFGQAANAADFKHPMTGRHYSELIDVDAWIDHNIVNALTKNVDALRISAYFHKDRLGLLAAGPIWDFDRSLGTPYDDRARNPEEWKLAGSDGTDYFNEGWWRQLFRDPAFKARYRDRFLRLLDQELSAAKLDEMVDGLTRQIGAAAQRNFARWPESQPRNGSYDAEVQLLKEFLRRRSTWIRAQLATW